jgi:hypothetical protein
MPATYALCVQFNWRLAGLVLNGQRLCRILQTYVCLRAAICPYKPNKPQGCPTLTVAMTVKLNEPQGRPILTVTYTVKPNEPHGYPTLTVTMTVKLTEPQGCLTLTAIVVVKLRVCPMCAV